MQDGIFLEHRHDSEAIPNARSKKRAILRAHMKRRRHATKRSCHQNLSALGLQYDGLPRGQALESRANLAGGRLSMRGEVFRTWGLNRFARILDKVPAEPYYQIPQSWGTC